MGILKMDFSSDISISTGNTMVSNAIWEKHPQVSFSKTPKGRPRDKCNLRFFEKLTGACFFQISRETSCEASPII